MCFFIGTNEVALTKSWHGKTSFANLWKCQVKLVNVFLRNGAWLGIVTTVLYALLYVPVIAGHANYLYRCAVGQIRSNVWGLVWQDLSVRSSFDHRKYIWVSRLSSLEIVRQNNHVGESSTREREKEIKRKDELLKKK